MIPVRGVVLAIVAAPTVVLLLGALSSRWFFPHPWPESLTFDHVVEIAGAATTRRALGTGLLVGMAVSLLSLVLAWPTAQILARRQVPGRAAIAAVLLLPSLLPPVGLAIGIDVMLLRAHLAGTIAGVIVAHLVPTMPYVVASLTAGFARHDRLIEAQAASLGASDRQRLLLVTLPAMRRTILVAAALGVVVSWSQYLLTVLAGSGKVVTITILLFNALSGANPSTIGVLALAAAAPAIVLVVIAGRHAVEPMVGR
ncbi:MAG: ABC transporter permease [Acidimicrobiia bacterium]